MAPPVWPQRRLCRGRAVRRTLQDDRSPVLAFADDPRQVFVDDVEDFAGAQAETLPGLERHFGIHLAGDAADFLRRENVVLRVVAESLRRTRSGQKLHTGE